MAEQFLLGFEFVGKMNCRSRGVKANHHTKDVDVVIESQHRALSKHQRIRTSRWSLAQISRGGLVFLSGAIFAFTIKSQQLWHSSVLDLDFVMIQNFQDIFSENHEPTPENSTLNVTHLLLGREFPPPSKLKIALLLSFPNSGTSYTLSAVKHASNRAVATNHCERDSVIPVYDEKVTPGPHLTGTSLNMSLPESFILTKTHCTGYCLGCSPNRYLASQKEFRKSCLQQCSFTNSVGTFRKSINSHEDPLQKWSIYSEDYVGKVIHLVRSPYDNIISRFHKHLHGADAQHKQYVKYNYTAASFQQYCRDLDDNWKLKEKRVWGRKLFSLAQQVPCRSEFFRYVQWHNNAFRFGKRLRNKYKSESLIVHYEDYSDANLTLNTILRVLKLENAGETKDFQPSTYDEYYSPTQRESIKSFIYMLSSRDTWDSMKRYGLQQHEVKPQ